jgi:hypothetical protein
MLTQLLSIEISPFTCDIGRFGISLVITLRKPRLIEFGEAFKLIDTFLRVASQHTDS